MELLLGYLFIFLARVTDVSLDVIRVLLLTRGRRLLATLVGFLEVSIFIVMLNFVLQNGLTDPGKIIAYAAGFATGNFLGSLIEERMAMGFLSMQIFPPMRCACELVDALRNAGFGVTTVTGEGSRGPRPVLFVFLKRKDLQRALKILDDTGVDIFYNVMDARGFHGGIFPSNPGRISVRR
ncbi:DUF2179 domain-containing protein [Desulforudis sp. 1088]|uniref:DUF2179 domain-containing protein n=1 Tax=unclassified Candidatus Desulforudis TaxID=2635950 RepID=UPI00348C200E